MKSSFRITVIAIHIFLGLFLTNLALGQTSSSSSTTSSSTKRITTKTSGCTDACKAHNQSSELSCKLSSAQMIKRKETVLHSLKQQILETKELKDGYAFKFAGNDKVLDELTEFIKTERTCCDFFIFGLSVSGDQTEAWLTLTGPVGAKDFISAELGLVK